MDDRDFFDTLIQLWAKTTGAEDTYWGYDKVEYDEYDEMCDLYSHGQDETKKFLGYFESEADADFVTAIHGCLPDLVRRLHIALDEADALDAEMDRVQQQLMEAELRVMELTQEIEAKNV